MSLIDIHDLSNQRLTRIPKNHYSNSDIKGNFNCSSNGLTSLVHAPTSVGGYFSCSNNYLTSLEHAPTKVGGNFSCSDNELTSLEHTPTSVGGDFNCSDNELTSLEHAPTSVGGSFNCSSNGLTSLEHAPTSVGGSFECLSNPDLTVEAMEAFLQKKPDIKGRIYLNGTKASTMLGIKKLRGFTVAELQERIQQYKQKENGEEKELRAQGLFPNTQLPEGYTQVDVYPADPSIRKL